MISATTPDNGRHSIDGARRNAPVSTHTHPIYEFKKFFFQTAALWLKTKKENKEDPQRTVLDIYQKKNLLLLLQPAMKMSHKSLYPPRISKVNYDFFFLFSSSLSDQRGASACHPLVIFNQTNLKQASPFYLLFSGKITKSGARRNFSKEIDESPKEKTNRWRISRAVVRLCV